MACQSPQNHELGALETCLDNGIGVLEGSELWDLVNEAYEAADKAISETKDEYEGRIAELKEQHADRLQVLEEKIEELEELIDEG